MEQLEIGFYSPNLSYNYRGLYKCNEVIAFSDGFRIYYGKVISPHMYSGQSHVNECDLSYTPEDVFLELHDYQFMIVSGSELRKVNPRVEINALLQQRIGIQEPRLQKQIDDNISFLEKFVSQ